MAGKSMETDCPVVRGVMSLKGGELFFFGALIETHSGGAGRLVEGKGDARAIISEIVGAKKFFLQRVRCQDPLRPPAKFHQIARAGTSSFRARGERDLHLRLLIFSFSGMPFAC